MEELKETASKIRICRDNAWQKSFLPNISHSNFQVRSAAERTAINAPIQGTAADILKIAMINIDHWILSENINNIYMIMQVHDELVFELQEPCIEKYTKKFLV